MIDQLQLFTEREAAARLGISPRTLFDLRRYGKISFRRVGKRGIRYSPEDIEDYIRNQHTTEAVTNENA